jgi:hypothetical protein
MNSSVFFNAVAPGSATILAVGLTSLMRRRAPDDHHERKDERMKLTTNTQVSVDGVMEGNGGQRMNREGFERGGWARPLFDSDALT